MVVVSGFVCFLNVNAVRISVNPKVAKSNGQSKAVKANGQTKAVRSKKAEELRIQVLSHKLLQEVSSNSYSSKKIKELIKAGADVNGADKDGWTVLCGALIILK